MEHKIYYHDTDMAGVVYYANYLKYFEEDRTEFFEQKGFPIQSMIDQDIVFAVRLCHIQYHKPAHYGNVLTSKIQIRSLKRVSIEFDQFLYEKETSSLIVEGQIVLVCLDKNFKPKALPNDIRKVLTNENIH